MRTRLVRRVGPTRGPVATEGIATKGGSPIGDVLDPEKAAPPESLVEVVAPKGQPDRAPACDVVLDSNELWYRVPQQARSRETLDRFLAAIEELLADRTFDDLTVADIAAHAERTVGSFYGRFSDKDAALRSLHARYLEDDLPYLEEFLHPSQWREVPLETVLGETARLFVLAYRHPRPSFRPVVMRAVTDQSFRAQCHEAALVAGRAWRRLIVSRHDEVTHSDPGYAADLCYRHTFAVLHHELLFESVLPASGASDEELIEMLTRSNLAVLTGGRA